MMGLMLSRRMRLILLGLFALGFVLFLPLRLALGLAGLERLGLSARDVRGDIWGGSIHDLMLGDMPMGSVNAALSPVQLLTGRIRIDVWRTLGQPDDMKGALIVGIGRVGVAGMTGTIPLGDNFAPLPVGSIALDDVSAHFIGQRCSHAEGRVRAQMAEQVPGLALAQGLSGVATCDGDALLFPLVSQSGMEKVAVRIWRSGRYSAEMRVETADPALAQALGQVGFAAAGKARVLMVQGAL
ncbi:MAG: type II secretion system protein N [Sphingobium sp.]